MILLRDIGRLVASIAVYSVRSGRWWAPLLALAWIALAALVVVSKVVVPTAVYTLF